MTKQAILQVPALEQASSVALRADVLARVEIIQRQRRQRRNAGLGVAALVTIAGLGYANLAPTTSYASWTAVPTARVVSMNDPIVSECRENVPQGPISSVGRAMPSAVLAESRGDFTAVLLGASDNISVCIADDAARAAGRTVAPALGAGEVLSVAGNGGSLDSEGARYVYGRVSGDVLGVEVRTDDGTLVTASVKEGYFLAWWPAPAGPVSVTALGSGGTLDVVTP